MSARQIVLDTETTGLELAQDHRVIEIGCVELRERRPTENHFHHYLNPERDIDFGAVTVHGITREQLASKPRFAEIAQSFVDFVRGAELIIHNAEFDVGFLDAELRRAGFRERLADLCTIVDTLELARRLHPGQRIGLNALCQRYHVDHSGRELHGALLDARLLVDVYLAMTGGQTALLLERAEMPGPQTAEGAAWLAPAGPLPVIRASEEELAAHRERLQAIAKKAGQVLWAADLVLAA
ncbi:MAG TPA: DNA polymerase III subunit epsilon [Candidatus Binatia bacterium]|nr:DNA polymerase III subunit epsilon [Candidatus Binatia bacterium]